MNLGEEAFFGGGQFSKGLSAERHQCAVLEGGGMSATALKRRCALWQKMWRSSA